MATHGRRVFPILALIALAGTVSGIARADSLPHAEFGTIPGHWSLNAKGFRGDFVPDSGFGSGAYAVPIDAARVIAFDLDSPTATPCARIDSRPVGIPGDSRPHFRFRCESWLESRNVVFVASDSLRPLRAETLLWESSLDRHERGARMPDVAGGLEQTAGGRPTGGRGLHRYEAVARMTQIGLWLETSVTFSGRYPAPLEFDASRGDSVRFGHYVMRSCSLSVREGPGQPSRAWYQVRTPMPVASALDWAFLPEDASEKRGGHFTTLYMTPAGYLLVLVHTVDFEGAGAEWTVELYSCESGIWRKRAAAQRIFMY